VAGIISEPGTPKYVGRIPSGISFAVLQVLNELANLCTPPLIIIGRTPIPVGLLGAEHMIITKG
jgi:hypothetical protein